ncbi:MAG: PAS domain S-box protein, partial [Candidatus Scalindua sp.]
MGIPLRVLIVEDVEDDAELLVQELRSKGYDPLYERVDSKDAMLEALDRQTWDIIICDYSMPGFNAISALELMHKIQNDLPFILVSGTIGEDVAVEAMKAGADDYIMKDNLSRFVPAIQRELAEYKERLRVRKVEDQFRKLHRAIEHSPSTVIITDIEGKIEYVNPRFSDLTGYSAEEAIGKNPRILSSGKQTQGFYRELWNTITSGNEWHGEFCNKKKNGELYWELTSISPVKGEKGVITNYVAVKEDITGRRQMEDAIQTLVKSTVGVTGHEFFDRIVSNLCKWFGTDCSFIGKISDESNVTALSMQLDGKITYDFSYSLTDELTPCGNVTDKGFCVYTERVCELFPNDKILIEMGAEGYVGISLRDNSDKPIGLLWTVSRHKLNLPPRTAEVMEIIAAKASAEIERMQAEADLQKSEERYRAVFEQAASSNVVVDGDTGEIVEFNTHAHENLGYTRKEFEDLKIVDIDIIEKIIKNGSDIFETKHRGKDGKIHNMIINAKRLSIPGLNFISTQWNDITGRKEAEEQIKKSLREKEVLLKEIHHRIKNNMQIVSSLLNLQSESVDDENTRQILRKSQNRVKSMALVHEKLYQTEDLSSIDFADYTRSLTARLFHSFVDKTNRVQLKIDMSEVYLDVNKAIPCGLIINEIVSNSIKHAFPDSATGVDKNKFEGKGVIKVSMRKNTASKSEIVELVVSDNGIGLSEGLDFR